MEYDSRRSRAVGSGDAGVGAELYPSPLPQLRLLGSEEGNETKLYGALIVAINALT